MLHGDKISRELLKVAEKMVVGGEERIVENYGKELDSEKEKWKAWKGDDILTHTPLLQG